MEVVVIGLGKIGLPLALQIGLSGHNVIGIDVDEDRVRCVNEGINPFPEEVGLDQRLSEALRLERISATTSYLDSIPKADAVVIVVPLLVSQEGAPDYNNLDSATRSFAPYLKEGSLVLYETTLPVGTTRNRLLPMIEGLSGKKEGLSLFLAFSPERVFSGRIFEDLARYPKVVGGVSEASTKRAIKFYESVLSFETRNDLGRANGVWPVSSAETAELIKLAETTYRDVNIALANVFARFSKAQGINFEEVRQASNSQPYAHLHSPGVAVGGHCIPVYPQLYLLGDPRAELVRIARETNNQVPLSTVEEIDQRLNGLDSVRVEILGLAYRGGVKESAFSGVFPLAKALAEKGAVVTVSDPLYSPAEIEALGLTPGSNKSEIQVLIFQADHAEYRLLTQDDFPRVRLVYDGRNISQRDAWPRSEFISISGR